MARAAALLLDEGSHARVDAALQPAVDRFNGLEDEDQDAFRDHVFPERYLKARLSRRDRNSDLIFSDGLTTARRRCDFRRSHSGIHTNAEGFPKLTQRKEPEQLASSADHVDAASPSPSPCRRHWRVRSALLAGRLMRE
jgi:hypothetical protein